MAKCTLFDLNSQIQIVAYSKGVTNIVIFNEKTKQVFDAVKLTVDNSLKVPQNYNLNLGAKISMLSKRQEKKRQLLEDSEWISDDPSIVKISKEGELIAESVGRTKVHLVSKTMKKTKLSTEIRVGSITNLQYDNKEFPSALTNIKDSVNYRDIYSLHFDFFIKSQDKQLFKLTDPDLDDFSVIDQNIALKCTSGVPDLLYAEAKGQECKLSLRKLEIKTVFV